MATKADKALAAADRVREVIEEQCKRLCVVPSQQVVIPALIAGRLSSVRMSYQQMLADLALDPTKLRILLERLPDELEEEHTRAPHQKGERKGGKAGKKADAEAG